jgi:alpha-L-fucosidase
LEVDTVSVNPHCWFWKSAGERKLRSVGDLLDCYDRSVGRGAVLLLNMTPDTSGLIPEADAKRAAELGAEIARRFGRSLGETAGEGDVVELALPQAALIDHIVTMEQITDGQRVREYVLEGHVDGQWQELCRGASIGHKKIDSFKPASVDAVRLRCTKVAAPPRIRRLAVYHVGAR